MTKENNNLDTACVRNLLYFEIVKRNVSKMFTHPDSCDYSTLSNFFCKKSIFFHFQINLVKKRKAEEN